MGDTCLPLLATGRFFSNRFDVFAATATAGWLLVFFDEWRARSAATTVYGMFVITFRIGMRIVHCCPPLVLMRDGDGEPFLQDRRQTISTIPRFRPDGGYPS